ncbi:class I SAM-dependent methyltransferase [Halobacteria archaeon AArc-curdl1]|uniref:Class I SAM-dependent methyltransferase n=1 Tax=Natronosalvus hydrolyticus TaxID=2979988 RepID=A0AAP2Z706_9EURY|nr:class I SAM-dependent methyltransferase [Halobacteria archaeon AArc-curdl1]
MSNVESFVRFCESDFGTAVMDHEAAYLKQFVTPDDRILDIGAGIGSIEERFPNHEIIGIDLSPKMIRTARSRVDASFLVGDARSLPVGDDHVDAVFFVATLEFIPEIDMVLNEATRVLSPDGTLVAILLNTESEYVQSNLEREGSYFQRMEHQETAKLATAVEKCIDGTREYTLGIADEAVYETNDPTEAAVLAISGSPTQ